jgi:hypothetical protein
MESARWRISLTTLFAMSANGQFRFKERVAKRSVTSGGDLKANRISALRRRQKLEWVIQGFSRHPHCHHIGDAGLAG